MQEKQVNQTKTRNNSKAMLHFIAIVLTVITIVSLAIGLFAWSKYTASINGNANAAVAKWNFDLSLKSGSTTVTGSDSLNLASTQYETSSHIANGKIAPGTSGEFDIVIDTRGTEVSMLYDVDITMTNCPRNITFSKKGLGENSFTEISPMQTGDETARTRTISFSKYLTLNDVTTANTNDTTFVETIKWDWPYELTSGTDAEKTAYDDRDKADSGITATLNITATGSEVMNAPLTTATVTYTKGAESSTLNNGDTVTIQMEDEMTDTPTLSLSSGTEGVTYISSQTSVATINENGELNIVGTGTTVITIKGKETDKEIKVNVKVKPKLTINVGDTIYYNPTGSYNWDKNLATSDFTGTAEEAIQTMTTGDNGTHNITTWKVLNVDNDTGAIDMVPENPSANVRLQGAQGYNNAVKLLNDACSSLYSDASKGIAARSINIEDIEAAVKAGGSARVEALNTAKTNAGVGTKQDANPYSRSYSKYPTIYEREKSNVITPQVTVEEGKETNLGQSKQTQFITKTESSATNGYKQAGTSIQPYKTNYNFNFASTAKENLLRKSYWVASRCVSLIGSYCYFNVLYADSSDVRAHGMFYSYGGTYYDSFGLFPVVSLSSDVLTTTGTNGVYQVE